MASINVAPLVLKDVTLNFGANGYEKHVSKVVFTPKASIIRWQGMTPAAKFSDTTSADWEVSIDYVQDWDTTNSFSKYLHANEGIAASVTFKPKQAGTPSFAATVSVTPGPIGGQVNKFGESTVTMGSTAPVLT